MFVYLAVLALGICVLLWWILTPSEFSRIIAKIPGPTPIPIFGNVLQLKSDTAELYNQLVGFGEKYGRTSPGFKILLGNYPLVFIFRAETAEKVLGSMKIISKSWTYKFLQPWLGTGLLTSTGGKWQTRRKLLTPTFHFKILADFIHVFNEHAAMLVQRLQEECGGAPFDVFPLVTLCTLDVICETAMGKKIDAQKSGGKSKYVEAVTKLSLLIMKRIRTPWLWKDFIYRRTSQGKQHEASLKILHGFTQEVIEERIQEMETRSESDISHSDDCGKKKVRKAFLDLLLHMSKEANLTMADIQEEVDTFMFEGHDTTAAAISWTIQLIGSHPEIQKRLHDEMDSVFGESDRPVQYEDLPDMKYLECVIKESLRLLPPVSSIGRLVEEDIEIDGMTIPKGAGLSVLILKMNRDPNHFSNPDEFNPERFLQKNSAGPHPFAYIPFSAGPRNCIGQRFAMNELKCVLSAILRKYTIESTQTLEEIAPIPDLILRPANGINIKIQNREN